MNDGPPRIFEHRARAQRRARAARIGGDAFLAHEAALGLAQRLEAVNRSFARGYALETPAAALGVLKDRAAAWDIAEARPQEALPAAIGEPDLAVSVLGLHAINDLPGVLAQLRRALRPDGLFLAALFGGETLTELRQSLAAAEIEVLGGISPRIFPFADVRDLGGLLQRAGFALTVADVERTVVRYSDLSGLFADLRAMGETNVLAERSRKPMRRAMLAAAFQHYRRHFADEDGKLRATFDIVYLTGWTPHESQQKPLKPGSAKARLAQALGTEEKSAGEKPDQI